MLLWILAPFHNWLENRAKENLVSTGVGVQTNNRRRGDIGIEFFNKCCDGTNGKEPGKFVWAAGIRAWPTFGPTDGREFKVNKNLRVLGAECRGPVGHQRCGPVGISPHGTEGSDTGDLIRNGVMYCVS